MCRVTRGIVNPVARSKSKATRMWETENYRGHPDLISDRLQNEEADYRLFNVLAGTLSRHRQCFSYSMLRDIRLVNRESGSSIGWHLPQEGQDGAPETTAASYRLVSHS